MAWPPTSLRRIGRNCEKAGKAAVAKFDDAARRAGVSANRICSETELAGIDEIVRAGRASVRPVGGWTDRARQGLSRRNVSGDRAVRFRAAGAGRALHSEGRLEARPRAGLLGRQPGCGACGRRRHAISGALARSIDVVTIMGNEEPRDELPGVDIAQHLARHKLKVDFKRIVAKDLDVASTILSDRRGSGLGHDRHGRLRPFAAARIRSGWCDARHP